MIYFLFALGFVFLIGGGNFLVDGASALANRYKISHLVIGLTIVAFGTSAPELFVNILASIQGNSGLAVGNILGSNISNVLLILGVSAIIYPLSVNRNTVWKEIPMNMLAGVVLFALANDQLINHENFSILQRSDGMILLCFFVVFLYYTFSIARQSHEDILEEPIKEISVLRSVIYMLLGLIGLALGGDWIVDGAVHIAKSFGLDDATIGLSIVAIGTSLPELATSAVAASKKNTDIAIGNVMGSNLFNLFWVLGLSSFIKPLEMHANANRDIGLVIVSNLLLLIFLFIGHKNKLKRWQGVLFVMMYVVYLMAIIPA